MSPGSPYFIAYGGSLSHHTRTNFFVKCRVNEKFALNSFLLLLVAPNISVCSPGSATSHAIFSDALAPLPSSIMPCSSSLAHTIPSSTSSFPGHQPWKLLWLADHLLTLTFLGPHWLSASPWRMYNWMWTVSHPQGHPVRGQFSDSISSNCVLVHFGEFKCLSGIHGSPF